MITKKILTLALGISALSCALSPGGAIKAVEPILKVSKAELGPILRNVLKPSRKL